MRSQRSGASERRAGAERIAGTACPAASRGRAEGGRCARSRPLPEERAVPHESPGAPYRCAPGSLGRWVTFVAAWLAAASPAAAQYGPLLPWGPNVRGPGPPAAAIHPAVARVAVADRDGFSLGSGTLVAASEQHGLLVTNWHVVRDATGPIVVTFPDGFRSPAAVLRTDRDWDLAALAIWRPNCDPVPLASEPPRPGEPLAIAGYGSGRYRTIAGRCTQYLSPGYDKPFEIVELSAPARQGDSGGPIFNSRGELAGVLFGTAMGQTSGSYCGRVRAFLTPLRDDFLRLTPNPLLLAQQRASPQPASQPPAGVCRRGCRVPRAGRPAFRKRAGAPDRRHPGRGRRRDCRFAPAFTWSAGRLRDDRPADRLRHHRCPNPVGRPEGLPGRGRRGRHGAAHAEAAHARLHTGPEGAEVTRSVAPAPTGATGIARAGARARGIAWPWPGPCWPSGGSAPRCAPARG